MTRLDRLEQEVAQSRGNLSRKPLNGQSDLVLPLMSRRDLEQARETLPPGAEHRNAPVNAMGTSSMPSSGPAVLFKKKEIFPVCSQA